MSFGSITCCYLCTLKSGARVILLGENHNIPDKNSDLVRAILTHRSSDRHVFFMEQTSHALCNRITTLDILACSGLCMPNTSCRVDLRASVIRHLVKDLHSSKSNYLQTLLRTYTLDSRRLVSVFVRAIQKSDEVTDYNLPLLSYAATKAWGLVSCVVSLDLDELERTNTLVDKHTRRVVTNPSVIKSLRSVAFVPVQETIVLYHILFKLLNKIDNIKEPNKDKETIVYIAGSTHTRWMLRLLRRYLNAWEDVSIADPNGLARLMKFFTGDNISK